MSISYTTKSAAVVGMRRIAIVVASHTQVDYTVVPRTTPQNTVDLITTIPILTPFPNVPDISNKP